MSGGIMISTENLASGVRCPNHRSDPAQPIRGANMQTFWERFWSNVRKTETCWEWTGSLWSKEYGKIRRNGSTIGAHRASYEMHFGKIPRGMSVCHRCDNPKCVRPSHLFLATQSGNMRDCVRKGRSAPQRKTHCVKGHPLSGDNLYTTPSIPSRWRVCRACINLREAKRVRSPR